MVKTYKEWRYAYNDCKTCYDFLNDNEDKLRHIMSPSFAGHLCLIETPITVLLLSSALIWNGLCKAKIAPELFLIVFLSINIFIIVTLLIHYSVQYKNLRICRTKIGIYQETWPTIIDVITDADGDDYLPKEPESLNFVELSTVECLPAEEPKVVNDDVEEATTLVFQPLIEKKSEEICTEVIQKEEIHEEEAHEEEEHEEITVPVPVAPAALVVQVPATPAVPAEVNIVYSFDELRARWGM